MRALILILLAGLIALPAEAQSPLEGCTMHVLPVRFGRYSMFKRAPETAVGNLAVRCRGGSLISRVTLSGGFSGDVNDRKMQTSAGVLHYNLFVDAARQRIAGDGMGGSMALVPRTRNAGGLTIFPIYGAIAPGQAVPAGRYSDSISIVVEF